MLYEVITTKERLWIRVVDAMRFQEREADARSVRRFVEYFGLDEVQHGIGAAQDDAVLQFLADRKVRCNVCPQSNVMLKSVKSLKEHPIKLPRSSRVSGVELPGQGAQGTDERR